MTDISLKRTLSGGLQSFFKKTLTRLKTDTSLRRTLVADPEGIRLRESSLC